MALNTINIEFDPCEPTPASGYRVRYRLLGSGGAYRNAGPFFTSPIVFNDFLEVAGSSFEGFIQGDCGGKLGVSVPWVAEFTGSIVAPSSEAPSSAAPSSSAPPPSPCVGICGRYQAIGESPGGAAFTWTDCDGFVNDTVIPMSEAFFFCTCDDDPQYSTDNVTVSRVGSCHDFNPINARYADVELTICGLIGFTAYLQAPATSITTGVTVYQSEDIGDPLTGHTYIDDTSGPIYNIDPVTGLVGAPTGNAC